MGEGCVEGFGEEGEKRREKEEEREKRVCGGEVGGVEKVEEKVESVRGAWIERGERGFTGAVEEKGGVLARVWFQRGGVDMGGGRGASGVEWKAVEKEGGEQDRGGGGGRGMGRGRFCEVRDREDEKDGRGGEKEGEARGSSSDCGSWEEWGVRVQEEEDVCECVGVKQVYEEEEVEDGGFEGVSTCGEGRLVGHKGRYRGLLSALWVGRGGGGEVGDSVRRELVGVQSGGFRVSGIGVCGRKGVTGVDEMDEKEVGYEGDGVGRRFFVCVSDERRGCGGGEGGERVFREVGVQGVGEECVGAKPGDGVFGFFDRFSEGSGEIDREEEGGGWGDYRVEFGEGGEEEFDREGVGKGGWGGEGVGMGYAERESGEEGWEGVEGEETEMGMEYEGCGRRGWAGGVEGVGEGGKEECGEEVFEAECGEYVVYRCVGEGGMGGGGGDERRVKGVDREVERGAVCVAYKQEGVVGDRLGDGGGREEGVWVGKRGVEVYDRQSGSIGVRKEGRGENRGVECNGREDSGQSVEERDECVGGELCSIRGYVGGRAIKERGSRLLGGGEGGERGGEDSMWGVRFGCDGVWGEQCGREFLFKMGHRGECRGGGVGEEVGGEQLVGTPPLYVEGGDERGGGKGDTCDSGCSQLGWGVERVSVRWGELGRVFRKRGRGGEGAGGEGGKNRSRRRGGRGESGLADVSVLSSEVCEELEESTRRAVVWEGRRFERWCEERGVRAYPTGDRLLEEYIRDLVLQGGGGWVKNTVGRIRRLNRERGYEMPKVARGLLVGAGKRGKRAREVIPFAWEWVECLFLRDERRGDRFVAVMVGVGMRLMLRPGEFERLRMRNVRVVKGGVFIQLEARKNDKVVRRDPWHFVECVGGGLCVACGVKRIWEDAKEEGVGGEGALWRDGFGVGIEGGEVAGVLNWVLGRVGRVKEAEEEWMMGKSCRVGGAIAAALGGVDELAIRLIGGWSSQALLKYIGGIIAARSGVGQAIRACGANSLPIPEAGGGKGGVV